MRKNIPPKFNYYVHISLARTLDIKERNRNSLSFPLLSSLLILPAALAPGRTFLNQFIQIELENHRIHQPFCTLKDLK
jgi:hypothetical protein